MGDGGRQPRLAEPSWPRAPWRELGYAVVAGIASILVAGWRVGAPGSLSSVWGYFDLTTTYAGARAMLTNLWISPNHDLAFPFGQDLSNFPAPDLLNIAGLKALVVVARDPLVASNLFLLLSFGLIVVATFGLYRLVGMPRPLAAVLAFSLSLIPWHFDRFTHAFLANFSTIAVGLVLVVAVLTWNLALGGPQRARGRTLLVCLALAGYVGLTGTYYAVFVALIALVALGFQVLLGRRDRALIGAVWFALLPTLISFAAAYLYKLTALAPGGNAAARAPEESQFYGGDLFTLLRTTGLWSSDWPVPGLNLVPTVASRLEADARNSTVGLVAVILTFLACGVVLAANGGGRAGRVRQAVRSLGFWPWLFMVSLLFFMVGGFGQVGAVFLGFQIRSWGRLAIVLVMIAYLVLGLLLTIWWRRSRRPRAVLLGASVLVAVVTLLDVVSMGAPFDRTAAAAEAVELRDYGTALDAALPVGCGVLTVPAYLYPEGIPGDGTRTYDPLLPYLFADHPRWSYGGVRGSQAGDWQYRSVARDVPTMVAQAKAAGFCAVQVDTRAFDPTTSPIDDLTRLLGPAVAASSSGRWVTFSLDRADPGPWTRDSVLDPATVAFGFGFAPTDVTAGSVSAELLGTDGTLVVVNPSDAAVAGTLTADVTIAPGDAGGLCPADAVVALSTANDAVEVRSGESGSIAVSVGPDGLAAVHVEGPVGCRATLSNPRLVPSG